MSEARAPFTVLFLILTACVLSEAASPIARQGNRSNPLLDPSGGRSAAPAIVTAVYGTTCTASNHGNALPPPHSGTILNRLDEFDTGKDGGMEMRIGVSAVIHVGVRTHLVVNYVPYLGRIKSVPGVGYRHPDKPPPYLTLLAGKLQVRLSKLTGQSHFEVDTPCATTAAQGTRYEIEATKERTIVTVEEGIVKVTPFFDFRRGLAPASTTIGPSGVASVTLKGKEYSRKLEDTDETLKQLKDLPDPLAPPSPFGGRTPGSWDAAEDFSLSQNPNGPWQYGAINPNLEWYKFDKASPVQDTDPLRGWSDGNIAAILKVVSDLNIDCTRLCGYTYGKADAGGSQGLYIAVMWTAPRDALVNIQGGVWKAWNPIDLPIGSGDQLVSLLHNRMMIVKDVPFGRVATYASTAMLTFRDIEAAGRAAIDLHAVRVVKGDTITLAVRPNPRSLYNDYVGLELRITPVE